MHNLEHDLPTPDFIKILSNVAGRDATIRSKREFHDCRQQLLKPYLNVLAKVGLHPKGFLSPIYQVWWSQEAWGDLSVDAINVDFNGMTEAEVNSKLSSLCRTCRDPEWKYSASLGILFIREFSSIGD